MREDLEHGLLDLRKVSYRMARLSIMIAALTACNVASFLFMAGSMARSGYSAYQASFVVLGVSLVVGGSALVAVVLFENLRKRGDVLFEEISDEFLWNAGSRSTESRVPSHPEERPPFNTRLYLRSYTRTADLPLFPGRIGPGLYAVVNLLTMVAAFLFRVMFFRPPY